MKDVQINIGLVRQKAAFQKIFFYDQIALTFMEDSNEMLRVEHSIV